MCFRFDGERAVVAHRPDDCRERLPAASARASSPIASGGEPGQLSASRSFEPADAEHAVRLAATWVLRRKALGKIERLLTIELDPQNRAVQVRGFGNRLDSLEERKIIERWAKARGVRLMA